MCYALAELGSAPIPPGRGSGKWRSLPPTPENGSSRPPAAADRAMRRSAPSAALRTLATRSFSLLQGVERPGWAVGVDGYTARMLDDTPASLLGQLSLNEIVYACMRERMKVLITPAFLVERRQADGTYVVDDRHELTSLLRRPGPNLDAPTLWRCLEASYASIGRLYLEPIYSARPRMLRGLNPLNPIYIQERYEYGRLVAYDWHAARCARRSASAWTT